jgi:molybdenum cofactor biosynthesis enzyme MoaA
MMAYSSEQPKTEAPPLGSGQREPTHKSGSSATELTLPEFDNVSADVSAAGERHDIIPGRGDLRISLTSRCHLRCTYCHNEGQKAPWVPGADNAKTDDIKGLLDVATRYGVKSVKFSGGDPGDYGDLFTLLDTIGRWRESYPGIKKWGICTSGFPFLDQRKFEALAESDLDNISIGIDSVEPEERSKPSSPIGISGQRLIVRFVEPLMTRWKGKGRGIKFDTVFVGDKHRTLNVIDKAIKLKVDISVIEVNVVMGKLNGMLGTDDTLRDKFRELITETAEKHQLQPRRYEPLNEIYLYDERGNHGEDKAVVKFYQDHCRDLDCGNCRKIHLRISPTAEGWGAVPCFLRAQSEIIPLVMDGQVSEARFKDAIRYNGQGPQWFNGTPYGPSRGDV